DVDVELDGTARCRPRGPLQNRVSRQSAAREHLAVHRLDVDQLAALFADVQVALLGPKQLMCAAGIAEGQLSGHVDAMAHEGGAVRAFASRFRSLTTEAGCRWAPQCSEGRTVPWAPRGQRGSR